MCSANVSKDSLACFAPFPAKITGFFASFIASMAACKSSSCGNNSGNVKEVFVTRAPFFTSNFGTSSGIVRTDTPFSYKPFELLDSRQQVAVLPT